MIINGKSVLRKVSSELYSPHCSVLCHSLQLFILLLSPNLPTHHLLLLPRPLLPSILPSISNFCRRFLLVYNFPSSTNPICFFFLMALIICLSSFILLSTSSSFQLIFHFLPQPHFRPFREKPFFSASSHPCLQCIHYNAPYKTLCRFLL